MPTREEALRILENPDEFVRPELADLQLTNLNDRVGVETPSPPPGAFGVQTPTPSRAQPAFDATPAQQQQQKGEAFGTALKRALLNRFAPGFGDSVVPLPPTPPEFQFRVIDNQLFAGNPQTGRAQSIAEVPRIDRFVETPVLDTETGAITNFTQEQLRARAVKFPGRFMAFDPDSSIGKAVGDFKRGFIDAKQLKRQLQAASRAPFTVNLVEKQQERDIASRDAVQKGARLARLLTGAPVGVTGLRGAIAEKGGGLIGQLSPGVAETFTSFVVGGQMTPGELRGLKLELQNFAFANKEELIGQTDSRLSDRDLRILLDAVGTVDSFSSAEQVLSGVQSIMAVNLINDELQREVRGEELSFPVGTDEELERTYQRLITILPEETADYVIGRLLEEASVREALDAR